MFYNVLCTCVGIYILDLKKNIIKDVSKIFQTLPGYLYIPPRLKHL
jgi:hypothetical protein